LFPDGFPEMVTVPITEAEITWTMASFKSKNSSYYEGISNKILKLYGEYLGRPFAHIDNSLLILGKFPDCIEYLLLTLYLKVVKSLNYLSTNQFHY
jgi:hypothetical protein